MPRHRPGQFSGSPGGMAQATVCLVSPGDFGAVGGEPVQCAWSPSLGSGARASPSPRARAAAGRTSEMRHLRVRRGQPGCRAESGALSLICSPLSPHSLWGAPCSEAAQGSISRDTFGRDRGPTSLFPQELWTLGQDPQVSRAFLPLASALTRERILYFPDICLNRSLPN